MRAGDDLENDTPQKKVRICNGEYRKAFTVPARKERSSAQHLSQNTSDTPHIDGASVFFEGKHDLWCTIPPDEIINEFL